MKNVTTLDSGSETQEDLIKIIRADKIGSYSWDTSASEVNSGYGINEWSQADLMKLLNPESVYTKDGEIANSLYWNSEIGSCYSGSKNANTTCDFTSSGISVEAREKIAKVRWNTGTFTRNNASDWIASATYQAERSENNGKQLCVNNGGGDYCNDEVERTTKWDGYIGLMNPSDFGYAVGKSVRNSCLAKSMYYYSVDGCYNADWLTLSDFGFYNWTLNPVSDLVYANFVFNLSENLDDDDGLVYFTGYVHPVAFLKPSTTITDALGTQEDPFVAS